MDLGCRIPVESYSERHHPPLLSLRALIGPRFSFRGASAAAGAAPPPSRSSASESPSSLRSSSTAAGEVAAQPTMRPRCCAQQSHGLQPLVSLARVPKAPQTTKPRRARESRVLRRQWSVGDLVWGSLFVRTVDTKISSFSRPWKAPTSPISVFEISISGHWLSKILRIKRACAAQGVMMPTSEGRRSPSESAPSRRSTMAVASELLLKELPSAHSWPSKGRKAIAASSTGHTIPCGGFRALPHTPDRSRPPKRFFDA
mmetsp:Transcript_64228/g.187911  ORF Transcript_64228/g.187911 Transcript_64228/m.187911 type:complete len:258 (-) Transcript_64228:716-1489(-)